jgi:Sulfite exporter TauE/SafE
MTRTEPDEGAPALPSTHRSAFLRMARTNLVLGAVVFVGWLLLGGDRSLQAVVDHWQVSLTMVLGSLVGGGTSEGGGAVAFPVLTKVLAVPADEARLFSFAIQSVGMTAASITIIFNRVPIEWRALRFGAPAAVVGVVLSSTLIAPHVENATVRLIFTAILVSLALALWISRRHAPHRYDEIELFGLGEEGALVVAGLFGGLLSGLAAVGENTIMFVLLVLGFRVCERVVTHDRGAADDRHPGRLLHASSCDGRLHRPGRGHVAGRGAGGGLRRADRGAAGHAHVARQHRAHPVRADRDRVRVHTGAGAHDRRPRAAVRWRDPGLLAALRPAGHLGSLCCAADSAGRHARPGLSLTPNPGPRSGPTGAHAILAPPPRWP